MTPLVTLAGITRPSRDSHLAKAPAPILVTVSGISRAVILVHLANTLSAISVRTEFSAKVTDVKVVLSLFVLANTGVAYR